MNYPSISRKAMPHSLLIAVGLTFSAAGLVMALSASSLVHAQGTPVQHNATFKRSVGGHPDTSTGRDRIREAKPQKSGVVKKNPQPSNTKQEKDLKEKAGAGSFTDRDQGIQRKVRRGLA